jgi:hypothetical protein
MIELSLSTTGSHLANALQYEPEEFACFLTELKDAEMSTSTLAEIATYLPYGSASDVATMLRCMADVMEGESL